VENFQIPRKLKPLILSKFGDVSSLFDSGYKNNGQTVKKSISACLTEFICYEKTRETLLMVLLLKNAKKIDKQSWLNTVSI
jgi:hypothetical protein